MNRGFEAAYDICLPPGPVRHEVLRNLAVAEALGSSAVDGRLEIPLTERDRRKAAKLLARISASTKLVGLGIGACSPGRRWPLWRYADLITQLRRQHAVLPVIICSGPELRRRAEAGSSVASAADYSQRRAASRGLCRAGTVRVVHRERQRGGASGCSHGLQRNRDLAPPTAMAIPITATARYASLRNALSSSSCNLQPDWTNAMKAARSRRRIASPAFRWTESWRLPGPCSTRRGPRSACPCSLCPNMRHSGACCFRTPPRRFAAPSKPSAQTPQRPWRRFDRIMP